MDRVRGMRELQVLVLDLLKNMFVVVLEGQGKTPDV